MATLYLKSAGGNWSAAGTWSNVNSAGVDNSGPPTAADNCIAELGSGNLTLDGTSGSPNLCRSFDTTSGTGSWGGTLSDSSTTRVSVGDGTAGAGNVAWKVNTGVTYTPNAASQISFISTNSTLQTIDFGGKTMGGILMQGVGGNWALTTNMIQDATATFNCATGTFHLDGATDNSGLTHTLGIFSSTTNNTRTLNLGAGTYDVYGAGNGWNCATGTNLTLTAGTSVINMRTTSQTFQNGGTAAAKAYNTVNFLAAGTQTLACGAGGSFVNVTRTGTAAKDDQFAFASGTTIISGTFTVTGQSSINRVFVRSSILGSQRTITNTATTMTWSDCDFQDIALSVSVDKSARTDIGDAGGNSNITFPGAVTQTWNGTSGGNWSANAWTTRVPLPQDDVVINAAFSASQTVTLDMPRSGKSIDMSAATGTPTIIGSANPTRVYGSFTLPVATIGNSNTLGSSANLHFEGRGSYNLTSNGKSISMPITIRAIGGTITLQDALIENGQFIFGAGTFVDNGYSVTSTQSNMTAVDGVQQNRTVNLTGTWTLTGTGTVWSWGTLTNVTITSKPTLITISNNSVSAKTFNGGGSAGGTYESLVISTGGTGAVTVTLPQTFNNFTVNAPKQDVRFTAGQTLTINTSFNATGSSGNTITLSSTAGGSQWTISKASGTVACDWLVLTDSNATGGALFYAGANSTVNPDNNTGWIFSDPGGGGAGGTKHSIAIAIMV